MGWRPWDVYACTLQELIAAWDGYAAFHGAQSDAPDVTRQELDDLMRHAAKQRAQNGQSRSRI